jgi:hypothetical protein
LLKDTIADPGVVVHTCNLSTEAEAVGLGVEGQSGLHSKTQTLEQRRHNCLDFQVMHDCAFKKITKMNFHLGITFKFDFLLLISYFHLTSVTACIHNVCSQYF